MRGRQDGGCTQPHRARSSLPSLLPSLTLTQETGDAPHPCPSAHPTSNPKQPSIEEKRQTCERLTLKTVKETQERVSGVCSKDCPRKALTRQSSLTSPARPPVKLCACPAGDTAGSTTSHRLTLRLTLNRATTRSPRGTCEAWRKVAGGGVSLGHSRSCPKATMMQGAGMGSTSQGRPGADRTHRIDTQRACTVASAFFFF